MKIKRKRATSIVVCAAMLLSLVQGIPAENMYANAADYSWSSILKNDADWFGSSEAISLADTILNYQLDDGGWRKAMDDESVTGSWGKSTIDNDATTSQIRVLAKVYSQTGTEKYKTGCLDGIDLLIDGQYDNGGWPQVFNDPGTYHAHITYNDNAMIHVIELLTEVRDKSGDFNFVSDSYSESADNAVDKGIQCILDTQIIINGEYTGWCQQHDETTLKPTSGRAYELASISASESVNLVNYLKTIENPSLEIIRRINSAVEWMTEAQLNGIELVDYTNADGEADRKVVENPDAAPIWARFYYLSDGITPMFVDRSSNAADNWDHIGAERRTGYAWYGTWPKNLVNSGTITIEPTVINGTLIKEMTILDADYGGNWSIDPDIQINETVYGDRDAVYITLPDSLIGAEYIRTACDSKNVSGELATFIAGDDIDVYVAMDERVEFTGTLSNGNQDTETLPDWLSDWKKTDLTAAYNEDFTFEFHKKSFKAGEVITLGSNGQSKTCVNYTVFVVEQGEPIITTTTTTITTTTTTTSTEPAPEIVIGDVNADGVFSVADVVMMQKWLLNSGSLTDWQVGDLHEDGQLDVYDLIKMKYEITKQ